jgi:predicted nucleotidyltransferase
MAAGDLARIVAAVAAAEPGIIAAWVFGSRARGEARAGSDLDVAILTDGTAPGRADAVAAEIARRTGLEVDVCRLEVAGPVLAYEIVTGGRRVFARDEEAADLREERVRREYLDTAYLRRVQHHYLYGDPL